MVSAHAHQRRSAAVLKHPETNNFRTTHNQSQTNNQSLSELDHPTQQTSDLHYLGVRVPSPDTAHNPAFGCLVNYGPPDVWRITKPSAILALAEERSGLDDPPTQQPTCQIPPTHPPNQHQSTTNRPTKSPPTGKPPIASFTTVLEHPTEMLMLSLQGKSSENIGKAIMGSARAMRDCRCCY